MTPDLMLDSDDEGKQEVYYQSLRENIPEDFRDYDFNKLIHNRLELDHFRQFLGEFLFLFYFLIIIICIIYVINKLLR